MTEIGLGWTSIESSQCGEGQLEPITLDLPCNDRRRPGSDSGQSRIASTNGVVVAEELVPEG